MIYKSIGKFNFSKSNFYRDVIIKNVQALKKTKIICTLGPAVNSVQKITALIDAGMNVARLNFSHGDHSVVFSYQYHQQLYNNVQQALKSRPQKLCGILLDTKGPQIRSGLLKQKKVKLLKVQIYQQANDYKFVGDSKKIACSYQDLTKTVKQGKLIHMADSALMLKVLSVGQNQVQCQILNDAEIGQKKNMALPNCVINLQTVSEKDEMDIVQFGLKNKVNFIALSFARYAKDITKTRNLLKNLDCQIISKIQATQAIQNFQQILRASDGIMVARGDLGMQINLQKVTVAQKFMIKNCLDYNRFSVTATQMLDSMQKKPNPTRAQISDITNAVLDGSDAVMLSGQTAGGSFPIQSVKIMSKTCIQAENIKQYSYQFHKRNKKNIYWSAVDKKCSQIVESSLSEDSDVIICYTQKGYFPRILARWRPKAHIIAVTKDRRVAENLNLCYGVHSKIMEIDKLKRSDAQQILNQFQKQQDMKQIKGIWATPQQSYRL